MKEKTTCEKEVEKQLEKNNEFQKKAIEKMEEYKANHPEYEGGFIMFPQEPTVLPGIFTCNVKIL